MEWMECLKKGIKFIEDNLDKDIDCNMIGKHVNMSSFYFQKGFTYVTGFSVGEYIRNRKLYKAGLDICAQNEKIIDIAYKYGYDTPESFSKAFYRFHSYYPSQIKRDVRKLKVFLPLSIKLTIQGGNEMNYSIEKMKSFKVIGFEKEFSLDNSYQEVPKFWNEIANKYFTRLCSDKKDNEVEKAISDNCIGELAICIDGEKSFKYLIAGFYKGGNVPESMKVVEVKESLWAKFESIGAMPYALQTVNEKIFKEWLPGNSEYELSSGLNIEWYSEGDNQSNTYKSEIWIPVKRK